MAGMQSGPAGARAAILPMHLPVDGGEEKLGDYLRKGPVESGYNADLARDGDQGLALARA